MSRDLAQMFAAIGRPRILVVGDLILDRYVWGSVERISPEAPVPILKVAAEQPKPGGAGSVAINLVELGARVALGGALGKGDHEGETLLRLLDAHEIDRSAVLPVARRPTTLKTRFLARVHQVLRVDREDSSPLPDEVTQKLLERLTPQVKKADIILVSDYNKGLLTPSFLQAFIGLCRKAGKRVILDPARGADPLKYRDATAICPNRVEAAEAAGLPDDPPDIDKIARRLLRRLRLEACIITRDREGMSLYRKGAKPQHFATRPREVFDVSGAGDMVLSVLGLVLAAGGSLEEAIGIANAAGGLEVARLGVLPLSRDEIIAELEHAGPLPSSKLRTRDDLAAIIRHLQARGHTVVFTNGCFDLLNANHIGLLRHARSLGDYLVVATNSDASIRRLKGPSDPSRPILTEAERVELLSALHYVDYVVIFHEDTPRPLLRLLRPDILVKGGDYKDKTEVVGWEIVEEYGGRIEQAPRTDFHSTSGIVEKVVRSHRKGKG